MPRVLSFINYKGGVGKTTTAYHVGCSLAQHHGQRVLMIDVDPQTNLTFLCRGPDEWKEMVADSGTVADLYRRYSEDRPLRTDRFIWKEAVRLGPDYLDDFHLIPCDIDLIGEDFIVSRVIGTLSADLNFDRAVEQYLRERAFLKSVVESVQDSYDWILIDCPPNLSPMTQNALCASDHYVVTAIPDRLSTIGLNTLLEKVERIGRKISDAEKWARSSGGLKKPELGAIVFVKVRIGGEMRTLQHRLHMETIRTRFPDHTLRAHTTEMIGYSEAAENYCPIWEHSSDNALRAAEKEEYQSITREIVERLSTTGDRSS